MSRTYVTVLRRSDRLARGKRDCEPFCNLCHRRPCGRSGGAGTLAGRRSLLPQVGLDDLDRDRCGAIGTETAALDDDADRNPWVDRRGETGENRVVRVEVV